MGQYYERMKYINFFIFMMSLCSGGFGGLGGIGPICGVPIGFGLTTTVGGFDPYQEDVYGTGFGGTALGYGFGQPGIGGVGGGFNRGLGRGPYGRGFL